MAAGAAVRLAPVLAVGLALTCALAAGCASTSTVYQGADASVVHGRPLLMLDASDSPPLRPSDQQQLNAQIEQDLLASPDIGPAISRAQFRQRFGGDYTTIADYNVLSDSLAVVGLPEQELAARLGEKSGVELLCSVQAFYIPCPACERGDEGALVGQLFDAKTSKLLWRANVIYDHMPGPERSQQAFEAMRRDLVEEFNAALSYKWQRQRFEHLRRQRS